MTQETKHIDPEKYYSASKVIANGFFPWIKSTMTFTNMLNTERGVEIYKPIIRQAAKNKRYFIKGSTIIEIRELAEKGELEI